jgi:hypothetical protein
LLQESALLSHPQNVGGKAFTVTDAGTAPQFQDIYRLCGQLTGFKWTKVPALAMLPIAYMIEFYIVARAMFPILSRLLPEPDKDTRAMQPGLWNIAGSHQFAINDQAALPPAKGGIDYKPLCTSLEGMAQQAMEWNELRSKQSANGGALDTVKTELKNVATPAAASRR